MNCFFQLNYAFGIYVLLYIFLKYPSEVSSCTTVLVGAKASTTHSPMVTHTADCADCDFRISKVPSRDWSPQAQRNIYVSRESYPHLVTEERGKTWRPENLEDLPQRESWGNQSQVLGTIPQVNHTYELLEGLYGIINEHQLAMGESSCGSKLKARSAANGGHAIMSTDQLSAIAMERCKTAKEAILLMGDLAETYGYYGPLFDETFWSNLEAGDTLGVIDKEEAWLFHISPDDTGRSAVWVAQRLPEDGVTIVANHFMIKEVDPTSDDFLFSANLWEVADRANLWKKSDHEGELLHFSKAFAFPLHEPFPHHTYASRRVWNIFRLVKPSLTLTPYPDEFMDDYPWYVVPDKLISPKFLVDHMRNNFEGTPFDMSKGLAAGPYGNPERFDFSASYDGSLSSDQVNLGLFERPVSMFRTSYTVVATPRKSLPDAIGAMIWFSTYNPSASVFVPLYVAITETPPQYSTGSLFKYSSDAFFWAAALVGNHMRGFHMYIHPEVEQARLLLENASFLLQPLIEDEANRILQSNSTKAAKDFLMQYVTNTSNTAFEAWKDLFPSLLAQWHDGFKYSVNQSMIIAHKLFYPKAWLEKVGYFTALEEEKRREKFCGSFENPNKAPEIPLPLLEAFHWTNETKDASNPSEDHGTFEVSNLEPGWHKPYKQSHVLQVLGFLLTAVVFTVFGVFLDRYVLRIRPGYQDLEGGVQ